MKPILKEDSYKPPSRLSLIAGEVWGLIGGTLGIIGLLWLAYRILASLV